MTCATNANLDLNMNSYHKAMPTNADLLMKMSSINNNSNVTIQQMKELNDKKNIVSMWPELMNGKEFNENPVSENIDSVPLSRILGQNYSYSSDSTSSPQACIPKSAHSQLNGSNSVFTYNDDSPQSAKSSDSRQSFNYSSSSPPDGNRALRSMSSPSDPGSPTLEDAILMGCNPQNYFPPAASKFTIADLVSTLRLNNNGPAPLSLDTINSRSSINPFANMSQSSLQAPNMASICGQHPFNMASLQNALPNASFASQYQNSGLDMNIMQHQLQNMWIPQQVMSNGLDMPLTPTSPSPLSSILANGGDPYSIEKAAKLHRNAAAAYDATCTWSGHLPIRQHKNPYYSCKVFLGGVPWDVTEPALKQTFYHFGNIKVEWPGKDNSCSPPRGYVYILFELENQVKALLNACTQDYKGIGNYYYKISSKRMRQKEVQVIPWVIADSNYVRSPSHQLDPAKTVFVGALHGMLSAEGLANIMNDLFSGVVYSGIDTDKHKYPIGSGRVTFNNVQSYRKAVKAAFIEIKTEKFNKKVQVDPYLADSLCQLCGAQQGPYFCRDENCFKYFCRVCWDLTHSTDAPVSHKPLMRNSKLRTQIPFSP